MKNFNFYVLGTHCPSCKIFIEDTLKEQTGVTNVQVDLKNKSLSLACNLNISKEQLANLLTEKIKNNGYAVTLENVPDKKSGTDDIWLALPIGFIFLIIFFLLQKSGFLNVGLGTQVTPITSFIIGLIASASSCLAVVGGLVLSISAKLSQTNKNNKNIALFHFSRLLGFALLGGLLGTIGYSIGVNFVLTTTLGILAALVMIILGLNLVGLLPSTIITLPVKLFSIFRRTSNQSLAPIILGFGSFFLPCGFTQSMQVSALSSGSFISGLTIMLFFALGTFPALALLSFGSNLLGSSKYSSIFLKSAGVVVIGLGLFAFISGLTALGIINPIFSL